LAAAIDATMSLAPHLRAQMSARAIAYIRTAFSLERMCARTLAVYADLLGRAP
jgi:hypothetical protein